MNIQTSVMTEKAKGFTHDDKKNKTVDWWTPPWIFNALGLSFDLDPCSPKGGVPWIPVKEHISLPDDGLLHPWYGLVWLNPPYGDKTPNWLEKMHNYRNGISLVFARTDCLWFHDYVAKADAILYLKGRVKFIDGLGLTKGGGSRLWFNACCLGPHLSRSFNKNAGFRFVGIANRPE